MKLVFDKDVISDALETSCSIVTKPSFAVLNNVLVKVKDNTCVFSATDTVDVINLKVAIINGDDGEFLLNGKTALSLIKTLPKGEVLIEVEPTQAVIKSGKFKANIPMIDVAEFPKIQEYTGLEYGLKFKSLDLKNALSFVTPFTSSDLSREAFCGVNMNYTLQKENNECTPKSALVTICATDGHRLAKTDLIAENVFADEPKEDGIIISTKAINIISKFFSTEQEILLSVKDGRKAVFKSETITLTTSLINGTFPDFSCIIPKTAKYTSVNKADLISSLKRSTLLNSKSLLAKLTITPNNINIVAGSSDGSMSEDVECVYEGEETLLGINSKYLEQSLTMVDETMAVICFNDNDSPIKILSLADFEAKDDGSLSLIMPMQI